MTNEIQTLATVMFGRQFVVFAAITFGDGDIVGGQGRVDTGRMVVTMRTSTMMGVSFHAEYAGQNQGARQQYAYKASCGLDILRQAHGYPRYL